MILKKNWNDIFNLPDRCDELAIDACEREMKT